MSLDNVPDRIYAQYRGKPKFEAWMRIVRELGIQIDTAADKIALSYDIDSAEGDLLDIIGRIVGVSRDFINSIEIPSQQFGDDVQFGDTDAMFSASSVAQDAKMSNELFRLLIKAKILKNNRSATIDDILEQISTLINVDYVRVNNPENMTFSIEFSGLVTPLEKYALFNQNIVEIPQGVLFNGFDDISGLIQFGDEDAMFGNETTQFSSLSGD